jgi:hypothetical protein
MQIKKLLGKLTPAHPDFIPILQTIREKYDLPEIVPGDETLAEILGAEAEIDPEILRQDILTALKDNPELLPADARSIYTLVQAKEGNKFDLSKLDECPPEIKKNFMALLDLVVALLKPSHSVIDAIFSTLADNLLDYLLTGETRDLPENWLQVADTMNILGETVIFAMCNQAADPKQAAQLYKAEFTKTFGKDRPKVTEGHLNTAENLRMKWEGKSIAYLVDIYAEKHPSQFPSDFRSKEYKAAKKKQYQIMKKRLQRLENQLDKKLGTKTG